MTYFVTGATGFIGRFLVERLLERSGTIYVLVRKGSLKKGMLADLVVLSDDIFDLPATDMERATVAATIFDGKIVYQRTAKTTNPD